MVSCYGAADGAIEVSGDALFDWNDGPNGPTRSGLSTGSYVVIATDTAGCKRIESVFVPEPADIQIDYESNVPVPHDSSNGVIELSLSGGTAPYDVTWPDGDDALNREDLVAGDYTITVTDDNGCEKELTITLGYPAGVEEQASIDISLFPNPTSGQLILSGSSQDQVEIFAYTLQGSQVYSDRLNGLPAEIGVSQLPDGIYLFEVKVNGLSTFHRIVKQ